MLQEGQHECGARFGVLRIWHKPMPHGPPTLKSIGGRKIGRMSNVEQVLGRHMVYGTEIGNP
jgi:hypothetical protein